MRAAREFHFVSTFVSEWPPLLPLHAARYLGDYATGFGAARARSSSTQHELCCHPRLSWRHSHTRRTPALHARPARTPSRSACLGAGAVAAGMATAEASGFAVPTFGGDDALLEQRYAYKPVKPTKAAAAPPATASGEVSRCVIRG